REKQSGKINFGHQLVGMGHAVCGARERGCKKHPGQHARKHHDPEVAQVSRVSRQSPADEETKNDHRDEWLENRPADAQYRLLVANLDVTPNQKVKQFAVTPKLAEVEEVPARLPFYHGEG